MRYIIFIFFVALCFITVSACNSSKNARKKKSSSSKVSNNVKSQTSQKNTKTTTKANSSTTNATQKIEKNIEDEYAINNYGESSNYFKIINATSKKSVGGAPGSGWNNRYTIKIQLTENAEIKLLNLWLKDKKSLPLTSYSKKINTKGSESEYIANFKFIAPQMLEKMKAAGDPLPPNGTDAPIEFSGAALISYEVNGAIEYRVIKEITKGKSVYMP